MARRTFLSLVGWQRWILSGLIVVILLIAFGWGRKSRGVECGGLVNLRENVRNQRAVELPRKRGGSMDPR